MLLRIIVEGQPKLLSKDCIVLLNFQHAFCTFGWNLERTETFFGGMVMPETASVTATAEYTSQSGTGSSSTTDELTDTTNSSLSGESSDAGTSTRSETPNANGGKTERNRQRGLPQGATLTKARVKITRSCDSQPDIALSGEGNVSATGRLDGNCIEVVTVSRSESQNPDGTVSIETVRNTQRACCGGE